MRFCTFKTPRDGRQRTGVVEGSKVYGVKGQAALLEMIESGRTKAEVEIEGDGIDLGKSELLAPIRRPGKIIATIVNTQAMLGGKDIHLDRPRLDMKAPSTVVGPREKILAPIGGLRPEVELAAVVGRKISRATEEEAQSSIFGYTVLNDLTAPQDSREDAYEAYRRDRTTGEIRRSTMRGPLFRSKNHDAFCPMGPWIVTPDESDRWSDLRMTTEFDGRLVQEGSTSEYLFSPAKIASYVSGFLSLEPGDIVSCGSVGWTREALGSLDPTEYVLPRMDGTLELEIEGIGRLVNPVLKDMPLGRGAR
ncbi:MAG: fumarylacetoacetate hydrolase family protein [Thaumarchaeota archaeon]|nr:fumarylacetoacetate hydrolase family protein [Nitrososphaerota archaeon]